MENAWNKTQERQEKGKVYVNGEKVRYNGESGTVKVSDIDGKIEWYMGRP